MYVLGIGEELYELLRPHLTLRGTGRINLSEAAPEVLLALAGMTDETVAVILRFRRMGRPLQNLSELSRELSPPAQALLQTNMVRLLSRTTFETTEVEVVSEGWLEGSPIRASVEGLFVLANNRTFLVWRRAG